MTEEKNDQYIYLVRRYYELYTNKDTSILELENIGKVLLFVIAHR